GFQPGDHGDVAGRGAAGLADPGRGLLGLAQGGGEVGASFARRLDRGGPELRRVGIDAEDDVGLALGDGPGQPVAEVARARRLMTVGVHCQGGRRRVVITGARVRRGYLTAFLRPEPAVKRGTLLAAIVMVSPV